jgi:hypothetical protein
MIIYTKNTVLTETPLLYAYDEGVFVFPFYGTETFTDPYDGSVWTWENVTNDTDQIVAVVAGGVNYINAYSLATCTSTEQSFFWDDTNGWLYVHHTDSDADVFYGSNERKYADVVAGYASNYNKNTKNIYDSVYYETRIKDFATRKRVADPVQFGLILFDDLNYSLINQDGEFDDYTRSQAVGTPFFVYAIDNDDSTTTELDADSQIFQGYHKGAQNNRESLNINGTGLRYFENKPVCQNTISTDDYPNAGDSDGELIPVAFGRIRRGICVPTNLDALTEAEGSVVLAIADPAIGAIQAISNVYSKEGDSLTVTDSDLTACTVTVTKPAGVEPDETKDYTWEGDGYDITVTVGDHDNGLNIIKECFVHYNNYLYDSNYFDTTQWESETSSNTQQVGISVQSSRGWIEEILQPITTSLQGVVEYKADGKLTFFSRDPEGFQYPIDYLDVFEDTDINIDDNVVSEVLVEYSPNFKENTALSYLYSSDRDYVINNYNIDTRGDFSPLKTVLYRSSDAASVAETLMKSYKDPGRYYTLVIDEIEEDRELFDCVYWDNRRFWQDTADNKAGEILEIEYDYIDEITRFKVREVTYNATRQEESILDTTLNPLQTTENEDLIAWTEV